MIISGAIFGMIFEEEMNEKSHLGKFFFAALSGIFLYISLTSFFPVLQALIDQAGKLPESDDQLNFDGLIKNCFQKDRN